MYATLQTNTFWPFPFQSTKERLSSLNATGIAMLFSAGTFLYVATVHVLPEIAVQSHRHSGDNPDAKGFRKVELLALVVGALLPLLLSIGHHHWGQSWHERKSCEASLGGKTLTLFCMYDIVKHMEITTECRAGMRGRDVKPVLGESVLLLKTLVVLYLKDHYW